MRSGKYSGIAGVVLACNCQAQGQVHMAKDMCKCNSDQLDLPYTLLMLAQPGQLLETPDAEVELGAVYRIFPR